MPQTTARTPNGLDLSYRQLFPGERFVLHPRPGQETALVLISGHLTVTTDSGTVTATRTDPFTASATCWYLPPGSTATASAGPGGAELAEVHAPLTTVLPAPPDTSMAAAGPAEVRGSGSWERHVTTLLQPPQTSGLLLGETVALDGRWSTYPPHRHQHSTPPDETALEEAFAFRVRPPGGFGVLITYDHTVRDARTQIVTDTALATVPHGYHTIAAAAGHDLYYLWAAHGDTDTHLAFHTDPAHTWLLDAPEPSADQHLHP